MSKKKNEISREDLAFTVLIKSGLFKTSEAYRLVIDTNANAASVQVMSSKKKSELAEYLVEDNKNDDENLEEFDSGDDELDKAALIKKFTKIAHNSKDDKVKLAAYEKIANIKNMKKVEDTRDDEAVMFYVPLTCIDKCPLYAAEKKRKEELAQ